MSTLRLMDASESKMVAAAQRLQELRERPRRPGQLIEWMNALTEYSLALGEVHQHSQQSVHEQLQLLSREMNTSLDATHRPSM